MVVPAAVVTEREGCFWDGLSAGAELAGKRRVRYQIARLQPRTAVVHKPMAAYFTAGV